MLNVLAFLGMVQKYKPKCQKATDHESLREAVQLVQEQGYSIRKVAAEKMWLLNLWDIGWKKNHKKKVELGSICINTNRRTRHCQGIEDFSTVRTECGTE